MTYNTFCPLFPGFYNTVFEYNGEDGDIEYYNEENNTALSYEDFKWDYKDYETRVSKEFAARIEKELNQFLPIEIEFQHVHSPREYNFSNDSINIAVSLDIDQLIKLIEERKEDAATYFKNKYTSCSGFTSFHSNKISDWLDKGYILENPEHRVGALLDCLCSIEIDQDGIVYWVDSEMGHINFEPLHQETID